MDIYTTTILVSILVYIAVGNYAGRKVKHLEDYFVVGRQAPTLLIVGTLVASVLSTNAFLGETGFSYATPGRRLHPLALHLGLRIHLRGAVLRPLPSSEPRTDRGRVLRPAIRELARPGRGRVHDRPGPGWISPGRNTGHGGHPLPADSPDLRAGPLRSLGELHAVHPVLRLTGCRDHRHPDVPALFGHELRRPVLHRRRSRWLAGLPPRSGGPRGEARSHDLAWPRRTGDRVEHAGGLRDLGRSSRASHGVWSRRSARGSRAAI